MIGYEINVVLDLMGGLGFNPLRCLSTPTPKFSLRLFVYRFRAFGVNSALSYYFLTRSVYKQQAPNTPVFVPEHINEHSNDPHNFSQK